MSCSNATCENKCGKCDAKMNAASPLVLAEQSFEDALLLPNGRSLPTLESDGRRRWVNPTLVKGTWWHRRRIVAYSLIAFFVTLPHIRMAGRPAVLIDILHRQFIFAGHTFLPSDTPLLAICLLSAFFGIMFLTAVTGRAWCGWGCPQTVYLEFLFRPIDRWFERLEKRVTNPPHLQRVALKVARVLVYVVCSMLLAHTLLSYFVDSRELVSWLFSSPWRHPIAFAFVMVIVAGVLADFLFFREQFCMVACPYGRFQSVMLDRDTQMVAYHHRRGEPRVRGAKKSAGSESSGDCIDCGRCVTVCPTGIDIRNGLQLECIQCTQCMDACDAVMEKLKRPKGLIGYHSQAVIDGKPRKWLRPRTVLYPGLMVACVAIFLVTLSTKFAFDARVLGAPGTPYSMTSVDDRMLVQNRFQVRLVNRRATESTYSLRVPTIPNASVAWSNGEPPTLKGNQSVLVPIEIRFPSSETAKTGSKRVVLEIEDIHEVTRTIPVFLVGPK